MEHVHDGVDVLEAHQLLTRLFLGHVVHAEELIVAEKDAVHRLAAHCWVERAVR